MTWQKFKEAMRGIHRLGELRCREIAPIQGSRGLRAGGTIYRTQYQYWCPCGTPLTDGPRGGKAVNAVCEKCRINYECQIGFYGDQQKHEPLEPITENNSPQSVSL